MKTTPSLQPTHSTLMQEKPNKSGRLMHMGMIVCCALMLLPIGIFFASGGSLAGAWQNAGLLVPILACVGMHLVLHKVMGKSCHGEDQKKN